MPRDRRPLRRQLSLYREAGERALVGFDFDCTLTIRHFFKVFAWGYKASNPHAHEHCKAVAQWCEENGAEFRMHGQSMEDPMNAAIEDFCRCYGAEKFHKCIREVFMGGDERILAVQEWLQKKKAEGVEFSIITAGTSTAVLRAMQAVPEWQPFFSSDMIWDTQQGRHSIKGVANQKCLILRDVRPKAKFIVLVDDSLEKDSPDDWVLCGAKVNIFGLEYEKTGISTEILESIDRKFGDQLSFSFESS